MKKITMHPARRCRQDERHRRAHDRMRKSFGYIQALRRQAHIQEEEETGTTTPISSSTFFPWTRTPGEHTLGFDHAEARYVYDEDGIRTPSAKMAETAGKNKDMLVAEGGKGHLLRARRSTSIHSRSRSTSKARFYVVVSGDSDRVIRRPDLPPRTTSP